MENRCQILFSSLRHAADGIASSSDNYQLQVVNSEIEKYQREVKSLLVKMDAEAKAMPPSNKRASLGKISELRNELQKITSFIQTANENRSRMALLGNSGKKVSPKFVDNSSLNIFTYNLHYRYMMTQ